MRRWNLLNLLLRMLLLLCMMVCSLLRLLLSMCMLCHGVLMLLLWCQPLHMTVLLHLLLHHLLLEHPGTGVLVLHHLLHQLRIVVGWMAGRELHLRSDHGTLWPHHHRHAAALLLLLLHHGLSVHHLLLLRIACWRTMIWIEVDGGRGIAGNLSLHLALHGMWCPDFTGRTWTMLIAHLRRSSLSVPDGRRAWTTILRGVGTERGTLSILSARLLQTLLFLASHEKSLLVLLLKEHELHLVILKSMITLRWTTTASLAIRHDGGSTHHLSGRRAARDLGSLLHRPLLLAGETLYVCR